VEPGFREALRETSVLSTRLVWFEDAPPEHYPHEALAMVTTHDLPTIAGVVTGTDDAELAALGRPSPPEAVDRLRRRLDAVAGPVDARSPLEVVGAVHQRLARTPAALVLVTLEDLCLAERRPNVPGTTDLERPNWSLALPTTVDELPTDPTVHAAVRPLALGFGTD
jgi:4-alpha-glucanotransferase